MFVSRHPPAPGQTEGATRRCHMDVDDVESGANFPEYFLALCCDEVDHHHWDFWAVFVAMPIDKDNKVQVTLPEALGETGTST